METNLTKSKQTKRSFFIGTWYRTSETTTVLVRYKLVQEYMIYSCFTITKSLPDSNLSGPLSIEVIQHSCLNR
jgi:hypothetical protein